MISNWQHESSYIQRSFVGRPAGHQCSVHPKRWVFFFQFSPLLFSRKRIPFKFKQTSDDSSCSIGLEFRLSRPTNAWVIWQNESVICLISLNFGIHESWIHLQSAPANNQGFCQTNSTLRFMDKFSFELWTMENLHRICNTESVWTRYPYRADAKPGHIVVTVWPERFVVKSLK